MGDAPALEGVRVDEGSMVPLDALFTSPRTRMASPLAEQLGCDFDEGPAGPVIRTDLHKETTIPGVFAAGDAARAFTNVSLEVGDGAMTGISAHQSLVFARQPEPAR